jgi:hypothetical protein
MPAIRLAAVRKAPHPLHDLAMGLPADLLLAMTARLAFGLFGTCDPGVGNFDQHGAIFFRSGAREPTAFGRVIAEFSASNSSFSISISISNSASQSIPPHLSKKKSNP